MAAEEHSHKTLAYFLPPLCMLVDFVALCDDGGRGGAESPSLIWETTVFIVYSGLGDELSQTLTELQRDEQDNMVYPP
jgi:hypothetical protein